MRRGWSRTTGSNQRVAKHFAQFSEMLRPYPSDKMPFDSLRYHRRSIRLNGYDYAQGGAYFVTVCAWRHQFLFGDVVDNEMHLNEIGNIIKACWNEIPYHFANVALDAFSAMPNHIHGIVLIVGTEHTAQTQGKNASLPPHGTAPNSLGAIIQNFKSVSTRKTNRIQDTPGAPLWQRNYYEHIIRSEDEMRRIRECVLANPARWKHDEENPGLERSIPPKVRAEYFAHTVEQSNDV